MDLGRGVYQSKKFFVAGRHIVKLLPHFHMVTNLRDSSLGLLQVSELQKEMKLERSLDGILIPPSASRDLNLGLKIRLRFDVALRTGHL